MGERGTCNIAISPNDKRYSKRQGECKFTTTVEREREVNDGGVIKKEKYKKTEYFLLNRSDYYPNDLTKEEIDAFTAKYITDYSYIDDEKVCQSKCNQDPTCKSFYFEYLSAGTGK